MSHWAHGHGSRSILFLVRVIDSQDISGHRPATLKIYGAAVIEDDLVHEILGDPADGQRLATHKFHVRGHDKHGLIPVEPPISIRINIHDRGAALSSSAQAQQSV